MNLLRRELAPISPQGWSEIDSVATKALSASLSGRKFVDVDGPHGLDYASVPLGRLTMPEKQSGTAVKYGVHQVLPLVETRADFSLPIWELDNLERGAKDLNLDAVIKASREIAAFEEKAIYDGFAAGAIVGLEQSVKSQRIQISLDMNAVVDAVSKGQEQMQKGGVGGPANLVVSPTLWEFLAHSVPGGTLRSILESQIGGHVIYAALVKDALLVANRGGDAQLTVGQDFAIGYHDHTVDEVRLFITESFTFRVMAPEALVGFTTVQVKYKKAEK
jgi:uncharacterized linocin/CFP29 family protein